MYEEVIRQNRQGNIPVGLFIEKVIMIQHEKKLENLGEYIKSCFDQPVYPFLLNKGSESCIVAFSPEQNHKKVIFATLVAEEGDDLTSMQKDAILEKAQKCNPYGKVSIHKNHNEIYLMCCIRLSPLFGFRRKEECYLTLIEQGCNYLLKITQYSNTVVLQGGEMN